MTEVRRRPAEGLHFGCVPFPLPEIVSLSGVFSRFVGARSSVRLCARPDETAGIFSVRFLRRHDPYNVRNRPRPDATELPSPAGAVSAIAGSIRTGLDRCVSWTFLGLRPVGAGRFGGVRTGTAKTGDAPRYRSVGGVRRIAGVSVRYAGRSLRRAGGAACAAADRPRTMRRRSRG